MKLANLSIRHFNLRILNIRKSKQTISLCEISVIFIVLV